MTKFEQLVPVNVDSPDRITVSARDLHAALAASSARLGDYEAANEHLVHGGMEEQNVKCPLFLELYLAVSAYADGLEKGGISLDSPEETV